MLKLNKNKICLWTRIYSGRYKLGDITVEQIWHRSGTCKGSYMWHVLVDGKTFVFWAYLKSAKQTAHKLDALVNGN